MGSLFSGKTTTKTESDPWGPQGDALKDIFGKAGDIYGGREGTPFYQGGLYAGMDPRTSSGLGRVEDQVLGQGQNAVNQINGASSGMMQSGAQSSSAISDLLRRSGGDPTQANIASAQAYANNPAINGAIDAASRDVVRNFQENDVPGINRAATGSGNINSSRAGVAEGIAARGAQDRVGDISSSMRADAYDRGLGMAENSRQANMGQTANAAQMASGNFGMGMNGLMNANSMAMNNNDAMIRAGQVGQQDAQGQMDADYMRWQGNDTRQQDLLSQYYGIVGANNWGGTSTNTAKNSGNIFGQIAGAAATAAGAGAFSDRRLKTNIVKTGELEDGLGTYDWEYIWGEKASGVMADEVETLRPWALGAEVNGFKTVNYAQITDL
jgi:hypothetical protein